MNYKQEWRAIQMVAVIVLSLAACLLPDCATPRTASKPRCGHSALIYYPVQESHCTQERDCTCGGCPPYQPETGGCDKRGG